MNPLRSTLLLNNEKDFTRNIRNENYDMPDNRIHIRNNQSIYTQNPSHSHNDILKTDPYDNQRGMSYTNYPMNKQKQPGGYNTGYSKPNQFNLYDIKDRNYVDKPSASMNSFVSLAQINEKSSNSNIPGNNYYNNSNNGNSSTLLNKKEFMGHDPNYLANTRKSSDNSYTLKRANEHNDLNYNNTVRRLADTEKYGRRTHDNFSFPSQDTSINNTSNSTGGQHHQLLNTPFIQDHKFNRSSNTKITVAKSIKTVSNYGNIGLAGHNNNSTNNFRKEGNPNIITNSYKGNTNTTNNTNGSISTNRDMTNYNNPGNDLHNT